MKKIALLLLMSFNAQAESLMMDKIRLNELAKLGYLHILKQDIVYDDSFTNESKEITLFIKDKSKKDLRVLLDRLMNDNGYDVIDSNSVLNIKKINTESKAVQTLIYRPKFREVSYLTDIVQNIFPAGSFTFTRPVLNDTQLKSDNPLDTGSNALSQISKPQDVFVFKGSAADVQKLSDLMVSLDVSPSQVNVQAFVYEVNDGKGSARSLSLAGDVLSKKLGVNIAGDVLSSFISIKTFGLSAIFSALSTDNRFRVVSSPQLRIKDREEGVFSVGSDVPVLGAIVNNGNGQSSQSIEYKQSGIILKVAPKVYQDETQLNITQELSSFTNTSNGVNNSPTLLKRAINTVVTAKDGEVIILGGLDESKDSSGSSGVPMLPAFTRSYSKNNSKSSILLVLQVTKI